MELHTWLDANPGKAAWLAQQLNKSKAAVSLWRKSGVPMLLMKRISELSGGKVTITAMLVHAMACRVTKNDTTEAA